MKRRSTRKFLDRAVEPEKLEHILRAAMQSPTGHNAQDWEFLLVTDRDKREAVSKMGPYSMCAANAPLVVIVLANLDRAFPGPALWPCDMGAVCQTILIQAEEEGLGGTWLAAYPHEERCDYLRKLLDIPENVVPYAAIPIGYKQYVKPFDDRFDEGKIHREKY